MPVSGELATLPNHVLKKLGKIFDKTEKPNWRTLISVLPKNMYTPQQIETFGMAIIQPKGSPTKALLTDLGKRGKTYSELINWLNLLIQQGFNTGGVIISAIALLSQPEYNAVAPPANSSSHSASDSIHIITQPFSKCGIAGEAIEICCQVHGDSPLCFQWFHGQHPVGASSNVFKIASLGKCSAGYYTCRVSNSSGCVFTNWACIEVISVPLSVAESAPLITVHPRAVSCYVGESFKLFCDAVGSPEPEFQWYFNDDCIDKATSRHLSVESAQTSETGLYSCVATNGYGTARSLSALVNIIDRRKTRPSLEARGMRPSLSSTEQESLYGSFPVSKVALLVGNENYVHADDLGMLVHPGNDTRDIAGALMSIGFTVVSLLDLNLVEFRKAVSVFCRLLSEDVYGVFYFAGHGFEVQGDSYLMPIDATGTFDVSENYPVGEILGEMVKRKSKLNMLILDCCRTSPDSYLENPLPKLCQGLQVTQSNIAICFGCCSQSRVLESPLHPNGFFAESFCQHVSKNIKIDDLMFQVGRTMHNKRIIDPANGRAQVIYRHSTLVEELSLCDPVLPASSRDGEQQRRFRSWTLLHEAPKSPVTVFQNAFVRLDFIFCAEFSNVLVIQSRTYSAAKCVVRFLLPSSIGGSKVEALEEKASKAVSESQAEVVRISNLELLEGEVTIHIEVTYNQGKERVRQMAFYSLAGKPLYAKISDLDF